ncbi:MAG: peptidoglycan bridge formation glycyltransferase FemA/FemB family protein, partial [Oscillospiraceae bacterium]|nr:peptidoglycan bridge formation glycyltransferase FemA/FemB family protein [Oscillospiraceae bacterium]
MTRSEISPEIKKEYEEFVSGHKNGGFMQTLNWGELKKCNGWDYEVVISRGNDGKIKGTMLLLIRKTPVINSAYVYAPRGPVCDFDDIETLEDLFCKAA